VCWKILGLDFESQAAYRASVPALSGDEALAVALQNTEYAIQRIGIFRFSGLGNYRFQPFLITIQQCQQQCFLAVEEVIEATAIRLRPVQQLGHSSGGESFLPKKITGRFEQPGSRRLRVAFHLNDHSSKSRETFLVKSKIASVGSSVCTAVNVGQKSDSNSHDKKNKAVSITKVTEYAATS
jgi:hypothetical protein